MPFVDFDQVVTACMDAFAETITFQPQSGPPQTVTGIFNERATNTKYDNGDEIVEQIPMLGCQASQFGNCPPQEGDVFQIRNRAWRVSAVTPDGEGHINLRLTYANDAQANLSATPPIAPIVTL